MAREIRLRPGVPRDATALYDCLIGYFDECPLPYPPPDPAETMEWGMKALRNNGVYVAECDGAMIGSVGVEENVFPWNRKVKYLNGVWLYVRPEFRKGGTGIKLIQAAKALADSTGMALRLDQDWAYRPELMARLQTMLGFVHIGGSFAYIPGGGA